MNTNTQDNIIRYFSAAAVYFICLIAFYIDIGEDMGAEYFMPILIPIIAALVLMQYGSRVPLFSLASLPIFLPDLAGVQPFPCYMPGLINQSGINQRYALIS